MTTTKPGLNARHLRYIATEARVADVYATVDPASIIALLDEVERLKKEIDAREITAWESGLQRGLSLDKGTP